MHFMRVQAFSGSTYYTLLRIPLLNMVVLKATTLLLLCFVINNILGKTYKPTWASLESRPLPQWFDNSKIGIFVHWGLFSVPALHGSDFWDRWDEAIPGSFYYEFMKKNYPADWTYADFAKQFNAELFDADQWVQLFQDAGAKYVVRHFISCLLLHSFFFIYKTWFMTGAISCKFCTIVLIGRISILFW